MEGAGASAAASSSGTVVTAGDSGEDRPDLENPQILPFEVLMKDASQFPQGPAVAACFHVLEALLHTPDASIRESVLKQLRTENFLVLAARLGQIARWCAYDIGSLILMVFEEIVAMRLQQGQQDSIFVDLYDVICQVLHVSGNLGFAVLPFAGLTEIFDACHVQNISVYLNFRFTQDIPLHEKEEILLAHYCKLWNAVSRQLVYVKYFDDDDFDEHTLFQEKLVVRDICVRQMLTSLLDIADITALVRSLYYQLRPRPVAGVVKAPVPAVRPTGQRGEFEKCTTFSSMVEKIASGIVCAGWITEEEVAQNVPEIEARQKRVTEHIAESIAVLAALLDKRSQFFIFETMSRLARREVAIVRRTFVQDILSRFIRRRYHNAVERLLLNQDVFQKTERALLSSWFVDVNEDADVLLVLSSRQIYVLKRSSSTQCSVCPPEKFCPKPPKVEQTLRYEDVVAMQRIYGGHKMTIESEPEDAILQKLSRSRLVLSTLDVTVTGAFLRALEELCPRVDSVTLDERTLPHIKQQLMHPESEQIEYYCHVSKVNRRAKRQERVLVITNHGVYNFAEDASVLFGSGKSGSAMALKSRYALGDIMTFEEKETNDAGDIVPRIVLWFADTKTNKFGKERFYDVQFGSDESREECKRVLLRFEKRGVWKRRPAK